MSKRATCRRSDSEQPEGDDGCSDSGSVFSGTSFRIYDVFFNVSTIRFTCFRTAH